MSTDITLYTPYVSDEMIPTLIKKLNQMEMSAEVHPDFSFEDQEGYLPFRFRLLNPPISALQNVELKSGFGLNIYDFNFDETMAEAQPKQGFFSKLLGKKPPAPVVFATPEIDQKLKNCKKELLFTVHSDDSFEMRFAYLFSAILAELTDGICYYCDEGAYKNSHHLLTEAFEEVKKEEKTLNEHNIKFHRFEEW